MQFVGLRRKPVANLLSKKSLRFVKNVINSSLKTAWNGIILKVICVNKTTLSTLREKCPNTEFFMIRIFPHSA